MASAPIPLLLLALLGMNAAAQEPIKATTTMHPDGSRSLLVINPDTRIAEETLENASGKAMRKTTYELDDRNQPLTALMRDAKGTVISRSSYRRDPTSSRLDEETISDPSGKMIRRRVYSYGTQNKVSRVDEYDAAGQLLVPVVQKKVGPGRPDKKKR